VAPPPDERTQERCPWLWDFLVRDRYEDGLERVLPEIIITRQHGCYHVLFKQHDTCEACQVTIGRLEDLADALEARLCDPDCPWVEIKSHKQKAGKKKFQPKKN
jgi:hypothetical protein